MKVVAEGVEDQHVLEALAAMECDIIQGYHIGRPVALEDFVAQIQPARKPARKAPARSAA